MKGSERKTSFLSGRPSSSQSRGAQRGIERGRGEKKKKDRQKKGWKNKKGEKEKSLSRESAVLVIFPCPRLLCGVGGDGTRVGTQHRGGQGDSSPQKGQRAEGVSRARIKECPALLGWSNSAVGFCCPPKREKHLGLGTPSKSTLCKGMLPVQTSGDHKDPTADFRGNFPGKSQDRR